MSDKRRNFRLTFAIATVLLFAISVFFNSVISSLPGTRVDMTSDKLFTLSPAAKKILGNLEVPVLVKLYITPSEKMPTELRNLERDLTEQLTNYAHASNDMLQFTVHNPQDDEQMQQALIDKGIRPFQKQSIDKDEIGVKLIWSAMTIAYKDYPEEILPRVEPQMLYSLESSLISPIYRLTREKAPKVAVFGQKLEVDPQMAMMYMQQGMQPPEPQDTHTALRQLLTEEHYEVVQVDLTKESRIPDDADVLLVLGPLNFNERQCFEINRALSNGLPTLIATQPHQYDYRAGDRGGWTISALGSESGLDAMLGFFGVSIEQDNFFDTHLQVLEIPRQVNIGGLRMQTREPVRAPMQIQITEAQMNQESILTNRISTLLYLWGSPLVLNSSELSNQQLQATTLLMSSDECWTTTFAAGVVPANSLNPQGKTFLGAQPLAVMLAGRSEDSFQATGIPDWPAASTPPDQEADPAAAMEEDLVAPLAQQDTKLIVIGCSQMFNDNIIQAPQNALLLLNAVDYLSGSEDLLSIRAKTLTQRVIEPVSASQKILYRLFVVGLVPIALTIFGIFRSAVRRKEAAQYRELLRRSSATNA